MVKNYALTKIYYIEVNGKRYYGHTTHEMLCQRKSKHVYSFKEDCKKNGKLYTAIREAGLDMKDLDLVLVEHYPCESKNEAHARERYWIEKDGELNKNIPNRKQKEYYNEMIRCDECGKEMKRHCLWGHKMYSHNDDEEYIQKVKEQGKKYREQNADKIREQKKQYQKKNAEKLREKKKKYREQNAETLREKPKEWSSVLVTCEICGKTIRAW